MSRRPSGEDSASGGIIPGGIDAERQGSLGLKETAVPLSQEEDQYVVRACRSAPERRGAAARRRYARRGPRAPRPGRPGGRERQAVRMEGRALEARSEERRVGKECRSRWS